MATTLAVMPKNTRNAYFQAARKGAEEAAAALGASLLWDGPTDENPLRQHEIVESWIARRVEAIAVSASDRALVAPALRRAREAGIRVLTWDADSESDAREFFVVPATSDAVAQTLAFEIQRVLRGKGRIAAITSSAGAANQSEWASKLKERLAREYPGIELVDVVACHESEEAARKAAKTLLETHGGLGALVALCAPAVPGAAQAVKDAGCRNVKVIGLATPNAAKAYLHEGWVESIVMWNAVDLGYLTVCAAHALLKGELAAGSSLLLAGRLGKVLVLQDEIRLGRPHIFTRANVDEAGF